MIKINKEFSIEQDFWVLNPQLTIYPPFSKLYPKEDSSKIMWCIFFMNEPDEELNKFFRMKEDLRKKTLKENYYDTDWEDEVVKEICDAYYMECMTAIERALKEEKDSLVKRGHLLRNTEPTLDETVILGDKSVIMKGTALQLDKMRASTGKIYDEFEKTEAKFKKAKAEEARVFGGRKETASEKGLI